MKEKNRIWEWLAHADIIVGMMFVVFFAIDQFNPAMEFLTSSLSKWLILVLALCAIGNGLFSAMLLFQRQKRQEEKRQARSASYTRGQAEALPPQRRESGVAYSRGEAAWLQEAAYGARFPETPSNGRDSASRMTMRGHMRG